MDEQAVLTALIIIFLALTGSTAVVAVKRILVNALRRRG